MHFGHVAQNAGADDFDHAVIIFAGVDLDAHLRDHTFFSGTFCEVAGFGDCVGEWFFAVHVQAPFDSRRGRRSVQVIGRGDDDCIDSLAFLIEHRAKVTVGTGGGIFLAGTLKITRIHIAEGSNRFASDCPQITPRAICRTDAGNVQFFTWSLRFACRQSAPDSSGEQLPTEQRGALQKAAAMH